MKIVNIVGARPQFVKAAVISRALKKIKSAKEIIIHTGQHFDTKMSNVFFEEMHIPNPDYNLGINNLSHAAMTGRMLEKIEELLLAEKPDFVIVYGDTNSTLAGALAAKKIYIPLVHIEAGLRSFNMLMPEEINRILTDRISDILFCPTKKAIENLHNEGFDKMNCRIVHSGDVMQDAAIYYSNFAKIPKTVIPNKFILCTVHRSENTNNKQNLLEIFSAFDKINEIIPIVIPLHPRTRIKLKEYGYNFSKTKIKIIDPASYFEMIYLLKNCQIVMTDSGGLQKEAYFFQKNCITLREETEWTELVEFGCNILTKVSTNEIINSFYKMNEKISDFSNPLYGDGHAGEMIVNYLYASLLT